MTLTLPFHNHRVALLDDDELFSKLIQEFAKSKGISVDHFSSVYELVDHRALERYDAVLVDVHFGQFDGFEVARAVRAKFSEIPILMISGDKNPTLNGERFVSKQDGIESILAAAMEQPLNANAELQCQP